MSPRVNQMIPIDRTITVSRRLPRGYQARGFALVISLSLMVLLTVLAVGLLSLSTLSLRTSGQESDMRTARANARLALMLAVGELQKSLGPDQRITATSAILEKPDATEPDVRNPWLTGVWTSRNDALSTRTAPKYGSNQGFRRWLVSTIDPQSAEDLEFAKDGAFQDPIDLVGERTSSDEPIKAVQADRIPVRGLTDNDAGKLAWWVGDENCKGFLNPTASERQQAGASVPDVLAGTCTPGAHGMQAVDPDFPTNTPEAGNLVTHTQAPLASKKATASWFHDLSPYPRSVLCNVSKGGLRQDLSLFLEQSSLDNPPAWPASSGAPSGPQGPNGKTALSGPDDFDVLPWKSLAMWTRLRKNASLANGRPTLSAVQATVAPNDQTNPRWNSGVMRPAPVPVRCLQFVAFGTIPNASDSSKLTVRLYVNPVIYLWNPYNVDLKVASLNLLFSSMPMEHKIKVNGQVQQTYRWVCVGGSNDGQGLAVRPYLDKELILKAGECRVLAATGVHNYLKNHVLTQVAPIPFNYSPSSPGGLWGDRRETGGGYTPEITVTANPTDKLEIETIVKTIENGGDSATTAGVKSGSTFDIRTEQASGLEAAPYWDKALWTSKLAWRHKNGSPSPDKLGQTTTPRCSFGDVKDAPRPFLVVDAKLKAADEDEFPNKTWSHCIPGQAFQAATDESGATPVFGNAYKLTYETISSYEQASTRIQLSPNDPTGGCFGSTYNAGGTSLVTDIEIPMAPLTSLAQLQNLPQSSIDNIYFTGSYFQNHAIGNSFASPGVASDKIKSPGQPFWMDVYLRGIDLNGNAGGGTINGVRLGKDFAKANTPVNDHTDSIDRSYAANHLLWDDYFFSSMAAKDGILNRSAKRSFDKVVQDFYVDGKPLPNERYKPYLHKPADKIVSDLVSGSQPSGTAWQKVSASLLVDGGFNINSVSVNAWKTLLAAANRRPVAIMNSTGGAPKVQAEGKFIVSRFTMPNGPSTDSTSGQAAKNMRWIGYRELSTDQIDALAHAIVRQVKARGPFRSLGEFINRRLGSESDPLTRYGALQAALEDSAVDINQDYRSNPISAGLLSQKGVKYKNPTAATGSRYQGAPAYVTQADLLGPIAPVLNARSDTFVIRAYGEASDSEGHTAARAWCEAVVQRVPDYLDTANAPDLTANLSSLNKTFGRRLQLVGFRWLNDQEI